MTQHLSSIDLQYLKLSGLDQADLPNWLAKLASLQKLTLEGCISMTSLPPWLGEVTSLKKIEVKRSRKLEKWLESKENKRFIPHKAGFFTYASRFQSDSDEEDISNESSVLGETSDESNEENILPGSGNTLTNATYNADDEGPLLEASSGSWASVQRARKGKAKQSDTDLVDPEDVPIISKKMRSLLELRELDAEAGSTGTAASASSPAVLSLGLNAAASASVTPRCCQRSPEREEEDDAACG